MKNLFKLSTEEKNRILNLHENATQRLYLVEQQVIQGGATDPYQYRKTGDKVEYAKKGTQNWQVQTNPKGVQAINNLFLKSAPTTTPVAPEDETSIGSDNEVDTTTTTTNTTTGGETGTPTGTQQVQVQEHKQIRELARVRELVQVREKEINQVLKFHYVIK